VYANHIIKSRRRADKMTTVASYVNEQGEDEGIDKEFATTPRAVVYGEYMASLLFLAVLWTVGAFTTFHIHRSIHIDYDQLRSPDTNAYTFNTYRYWTPAWWILALPVLFRPLVAYFSFETVIRTFDSPPRAKLLFVVRWSILFDLAIAIYLIVERYLFANIGTLPWGITHSESWCHTHYAAHPEVCSNDRGLLIPPHDTSDPRHEATLALIFSVLHFALGIGILFVAKRLGSSKPRAINDEAMARDYREMKAWHIALLGALAVVALLYVGVAVRNIRMEYLFVRTPSADNPFLSSRYGIVWAVHMVGVIFLPLAVYSGVMMLAQKDWSAMAADTHRFFLLFAVIDGVVRLVLCIISLFTCNGGMLLWTNTCHSRRLCCVRFNDWVGNRCAGVGLLFGPDTTPANYIWACDPYVYSPAELDRDAAFTWVFATTGFSLLFLAGLLWNWSHLRVWHKNIQKED